MDRLFRIDFYPQDWIAKTGDLTPEECGVYIQIIAMIYAHQGPIFYDAETLSRKLKSCSVRLLKSIVQRLIDKHKITLRDGKIGQGRAEYELNSKRTHLELSANGGRTKAENARQINKNKDLASTETPIPVASSTATATPIAKEDVVAKSGEGISIYMLGEQIAEVVGWKDDPRWMGNYSRLLIWIDHGWDFDLDILPTIKKIMAKKTGSRPSSLNYFEKAIADAVETRLRPLPTGQSQRPQREEKKSHSRKMLEVSARVAEKLERDGYK